MKYEVLPMAHRLFKGIAEQRSANYAGILMKAGKKLFITLFLPFFLTSCTSRTDDDLAPIPGTSFEGPWNKMTPLAIRFTAVRERQRSEKSYLDALPFTNCVHVIDPHGKDVGDQLVEAFRKWQCNGLVVFIGRAPGGFWAMEGWEDNDASGQKTLRICRYDSAGRKELIPLTFKFIPETATKKDSDAICMRIKKACEKIDAQGLSLSGLKFKLPSPDPYTNDGILLTASNENTGESITWSLYHTQEMCWYFYHMDVYTQARK